jgi:hypothetical protein
MHMEMHVDVSCSSGAVEMAIDSIDCGDMLETFFE